MLQLGDECDVSAAAVSEIHSLLVLQSKPIYGIVSVLITLRAS